MTVSNIKKYIQNAKRTFSNLVDQWYGKFLNAALIEFVVHRCKYRKGFRFCGFDIKFSWNNIKINK